MIRPADLEARLWAGDLGLIDRAYLHRAHSERPEGTVFARHGLKQAWIETLGRREQPQVEVLADLSALSASIVSAIEAETGRVQRAGLHRWVDREGDWIVRETVVEDTPYPGLALVAAARRIAEDQPLPDAPALGELRAGRGQLPPAPAALLADEPPPLARRAADLWHGLWNGRALDLAARLAPDPAGADVLRRFVLTWTAALPDAELLFDRVTAEGDVAALLWRLHGHHQRPLHGLAASGRRLRLWGSLVLRFDGEAVIGAHMAAAEAAAMAALWRAPA